MVTPNAAMNAARAGSPGRISSVVPGALEFVGAELTADHFVPGQKVDVAGIDLGEALALKGLFHAAAGGFYFG